MMGQWNGQRIQGPGHGSLVQTPGGEVYMVYHAHPADAGECTRYPFIVKIELDGNGWPVPVFPR